MQQVMSGPQGQGGFAPGAIPASGAVKRCAVQRERGEKSERLVELRMQAREEQGCEVVGAAEVDSVYAVEELKEVEEEEDDAQDPQVGVHR